GVDTGAAPELTEAERDAILNAADLVTLARTAVDTDYRGDVIDAHAPEMPTRFARQLTQLFRGAVVIGLDRTDAIRLVIRCPRASMPPLRLAIIDDLADHPDSTPTRVRKRLGKPRATVDRALQALHILGVAVLDEEEKEHRTHWYYSLGDDIDPDVLKPEIITRNITTTTYPHREVLQDPAPEEAPAGTPLPTPTDISGNNGKSPRPAQPTGPDD